MNRPLLALFKKEVRVIFRDPSALVGTLLVPLVLFPLMGSAIHVGQEATANELASLEVGWLSHDVTPDNASYARALYAAMVQSNLSLINISAPDDTSGVAVALEKGVNTLLVVDANFSSVIAAGHAATVRIYQVLKNFGPADLGGDQSVRAVLAGFNAGVAATRASGSFNGSTPEEILYPARAHSASVIHGQIREVPPDEVINTVLGGSIMLPIVVSIMILSSAQLAATSVASEKEEKTLEVLLTLPTRRENILLGKLAGVFVMAVIGTVAALIGFSSYAGNITSSMPTADAAATGLAPEAQGYVLLVTTLLLAFVSSLSVAVLVASYAKDIYGAQSLMAVVYIPIFLPSILLSFTPINILPPAVQVGILGIPFSYPALAGKALYTHDYGLLYFGVAYQVAFMAVVLFLAARMFTTEKVLTARLSFGKRAKKEAQRDDS